MSVKEQLKLQVENIVKPLINNMDIEIVEVIVAPQKSGLRINLVLYRQGGITLDDLVILHKSVRPRLEIEMERNNLTLEISSPGVNRVLKEPRECAIFHGRKVRALFDDQWYSGLLDESCFKGHIAIEEKEGVAKYVSFEKLKKVMLD